MQKLGRNNGGYHGDRIEIDSVLREIRDQALMGGWEFDPIPSEPEFGLHAWKRPAPGSRRKIYLSSGIHGDEPAGPLAIAQLVRENRWPPDVEIWLCPCLNPTGFAANRRENAQGVDLNRQYLHLEAAETRAHVNWLKRQAAFDVAICLHEDWESHGFYLYELNPDDRPSHSAEIIRRVAEVCPIDRSAEIEGRPAEGGIIRPATDPRSRPQWPEAFWLLTYKTRHSYTLEAPSDFPLDTRVNALVTAVRAIVDE